MAAAVVGACAVASMGTAWAQTPPVDTERPGAPREVDIQPYWSLADPAVDDGAIEFTWIRSTDDTGISEYRVLRNGVIWTTTTGDARSLVVDDLPFGVNFLQMQAVDLAGNESVRTPPRITVIDDQRPPAPTNVTAELVARRRPSSVQALDIEFEFDLPSDPAGFNWYGVTRNGIGTSSRSPFPFEGPLLSSLEPGRLTVVPDSQPPGTGYYQLTLTDGLGNPSVRSAPVRIDTPAYETGAPSWAATPTVEVNDGSVDIAWPAAEDPSGIGWTHVRIEPALDGGAAPGGRVDAWLPDGETSFSVAAPARGGFVATVTVMDVWGNPSSATVPFEVVLDDDLPTRPTFGLFLAGDDQTEPPADAGTTMLSVTWNNPGFDVDGTPIRRYELFVDDTYVSDVVAAGLPPVALPDFPVGEHEVRLRSVDAQGRTSSLTDPVVHVAIDALAPMPPSLPFVAVDGDDVHFIFSADRIRELGRDPAVGYRLVGDDLGVGDTLLDWTETGWILGFQREIEIPDVAPGTYRVSLVAVDADGFESEPGRPVTITVR